jgi:DNA endonuclease I-like protein
MIGIYKIINLINNKIYKGKIISEETKNKLKKTFKENFAKNPNYKNYTWKAVYKIDIDDNIIEEYKSITLAAKLNNTKLVNISQCLHGRNKTANGFKWKFKEGKEGVL